MMAAIYNLIVQPKKGKYVCARLCAEIMNVKAEDKGGKLLTVNQSR